MSIKIQTSIIAVIFSVTMLSAQPLISVDQLAGLNKSKDVLLVSVQSAKEYNKVHIANAINLYYRSLNREGIDLKGKLLEPAALYKLLGSKGIDPAKTIILYDAKTGKYASRVFWILDYLGYKNVKILDGQMEAWKAKRKPVTAIVKKAKKITITGLVPDPAKIAFINEVQSAIETGESLLIDTRSVAVFNGVEGRYAVKGHLPGAINIPFNKVIKKGSFAGKEELMKILNKNGIDGSKPIIVYCNTGVLATTVYFALKEIAGFDNIKVYDGSFEEWADAGNKVE